MFCRLDRPGLSIWELGNIVSLITWSISCLTWSFLTFLTITSYLSDFAVIYVGSRLITEVIASIQSFRSDCMVSGVMLRIGTISVLARK